MKKSDFRSISKLVSLWLPTILWSIFIFSFSSVTTPKVSDVHIQDLIIKKLAHLIEYGIFAILLFRSLKGMGITSKKAFACALFISIFYGITDEYHQSFTPGREPTVRDALIDGVGSILGLLSIKNLLPIAPDKLQMILRKIGISYYK